ncbi:MAG: hypothetical protein HW421_1145 [Ignavibacteria bacterium]|nr:hypothetical protein [Ignavibacteria bacterium]
MKTLRELCNPRKSVFDQSKSEDVLDLTDLLEKNINPETFFNENFITEGMDLLFKTAFERFHNKSARGLIKLTQSMGGGKTHNMIALGLLAAFPEYRKKLMGENYNDESLGEVRVVSFTGRQSDIPYGIWGEIANQLGNKELFKDYYTPLSAPGQNAWISLLKDKPTLILLDEIPPYLENAKAKTIGNSDLSVVTTTALANLFNALNRKELSNVLIVISDLKATYESGSRLLQSTFKELDSEISRSSLDLVPVGSSSDEVYHILKKRIFETLPADSEVIEIANAYKKSINDARQMGLTNMSADKIFLGIKDSYPFHPSIKELYERFKENTGFQQTRGLIRLMRLMVKQLYESNKVDGKFLVNVYEMDLNDGEMHTMISQINNSLVSAISHDIANKGKAVAEYIDTINHDESMQHLSKLLLISSLADVPNALLGLTGKEVIGYLTEPGKDITVIKKSLDQFISEAWYLHADKDGRFYFKNLRNLIAELNSLVDSYDDESAKKELKQFLQNKFKTTVGDCYQNILVFPALDEINLTEDKIALILFEPYYRGGINPELEKLFQDTQFKNRILFLSGQRNTMDNLLKVAKEYKAIQVVINRMKDERVPENNPQFEMASDKEHKILLSLLSSARETFMTLYFPSHFRNEDILSSADFLMEFQGNDFNAEQQIRDLLISKQKFTKETNSDVFKKKCEDRLFTQKEMRWVDVKRRAATNPQWQWHHPKALDALLEEMLKKNEWKDKGSGYYEKPPFPKEKTDVFIQEMFRNDKGNVTLKISPKYGDTVFYEIDGVPTSASTKIENFDKFETQEMIINFLCIDSKNEHESGEVKTWKNSIKLKYRVYDKNDEKYVELKASPESVIKYTTDGSDPKENGGIYNGDFAIPSNSTFVLAIAEKKGIYSEPLQIKIDHTQAISLIIDKQKPLKYRHKTQTSDTNQSYKELQMLKKYGVEVNDLIINIIITINESSEENWLMTTIDPKLYLNSDRIEKQLEMTRDIYSDLGNVNLTFEYTNMKFPSGQHFEDWIAENKIDKKTINQGDVKQ